MMAQPQPQSHAESAPSAGEVALARFRLRARARIAWLRILRGDAGWNEVDAILDDRDSPEAEQSWRERQPWWNAWIEEMAAIRAARAQCSRFSRLCQIFDLNEAEQDLLEACLAISLDPSLARLCGWLQDHASRTYMTEPLAARLYGHGRCGVWSTESALFRWEVVTCREGGPGEPRILECDPSVRDWLLGQHPLHEALVGVAQLHGDQPPPGSWPVADIVAAVERRIDSGNRVRVIVEGARGSGRRTFAAVASRALGMPLLAIDSDAVSEPEWRRVYMLAQRHAYLEHCALAWYGDNAARRAWPAAGPAYPLQFAIVETAAELPAVAEVTDHRMRMPRLTVEERSNLWRRHVPESQAWPEQEFRTLAERYRVQAGDIAWVAASRVDSAGEAARRVREASRGRLGNLAELMPCPFQWDDLVAPPGLKEVLEDIVYEAGNRASFWEQPEPRRLFPQGQGLMALFSGPPGTGKTMATQVMAARLGYDLFRINLAGVVSKWVGETSQNFERILTRAADMHAMLLFDECDAIFSKRTSEVRDAQDKFANTDAAYLLQAIESYPGVALLATNQKGNIDGAFIRRLRYVLEFAKPDAAERLEIWRKVTAGLAGADRAAAMEGGLAILADAVEATGAQIKYAVLGGVFAARREGEPIELRHLLRGLDREMEKEGRGLGTRERERILSHG